MFRMDIRVLNLRVFLEGSSTMWLDYIGFLFIWIRPLLLEIKGKIKLQIKFHGAINTAFSSFKGKKKYNFNFYAQLYFI